MSPNSIEDDDRDSPSGPSRCDHRLLIVRAAENDIYSFAHELLCKLRKAV